MSPQVSPIIVAGMHRSGTSFTASLLSALAVDMGRQLLPQDTNNRRGYFEDVEFLELQQRILSESCAHDDGGHPDWGWTESESLERAGFERFLPEARALIASRTDCATLWGWKDPRTTLLLDFWDELLEEARYVLVYRFPWDVADSMQRLGAEVFLRNPEYAYRIWKFYNRHLHDFYNRHADRCLLVSSNALPNKLGEFKRLLGDKLGLQVSDATLAEIYESDLLKSIAGADPLIDLIAAVWPDCTRLLAELDELADISGADLWQARPVRSRLARPDTNVGDNVIELSVVTPCYEQGTLLIEAIASVERFAPPNCELIIVNDGSQQPRTLEILEVLKRCGYFIIDQQNLGLSAARNAAITVARGRYILPLDGDNRIRANLIEDAIRVLDSSEDVGIVYGDRYDFGLRTGVDQVREFDLAQVLKRNYIDACAVFRKQVWSDCQGYDADMSPLEDWELWIHAAERGWRFHHLTQVTFDYRVRPGSLITQISSLEIEEDYRRKFRRKHPESYWKMAVKQLEQSERLLAEQAEQQHCQSEEIHRLNSEADLLKTQLAERDQKLLGLAAELALLKAQSAAREQELQVAASDVALKTAEVQALREQLADNEAQLANMSDSFSAQLANMSDSFSAQLANMSDSFSAQLAVKEGQSQALAAELARIKSSRGWRWLGFYWQVRHRYLLPMYRLLNLHSRDKSFSDEPESRGAPREQ